MITAFVLVIVEPGKEGDVKKKLMNLPQAKEVHEIYGEYDLIIKVQTKSLQELDAFVTKLRKIKNVRATSTLIASD
ncbi:Lrp/AsnC family transcriptional regulator [Nanoarchaeota archaeon]|nr:MAG: Lrp/AsnC family transcriptional regulator [Nanoarchaeota archaeon]